LEELLQCGSLEDAALYISTYIHVLQLQFLKGVCYEIFVFMYNRSSNPLNESDTRFSSSCFHESISPGPLSIPIGQFEFLRKLAEIFATFVFISGVNNTGDKLFTGVNDTGDESVAKTSACLHLKMNTK
jgi:hypothetical protein